MTLRKLEESTFARTVATLGDDIVTPPAEFDFPKLQGDKDKDARDGNGAREGGRGDKVVLCMLVLLCSETWGT